MVAFIRRSTLRLLALILMCAVVIAIIMGTAPLPGWSKDKDAEVPRHHRQDARKKDPWYKDPHNKDPTNKDPTNKDSRNKDAACVVTMVQVSYQKPADDT